MIEYSRRTLAPDEDDVEDNADGDGGSSAARCCPWP